VGQLKVGIAGYGVVGKRRKLCADKHPDLKVVAVCDKTFSTEGALFDDIYCYKSYTKLLEQDLDILIVCLTNDVAAEVTIAGLNLGLHVFCEKPPGKNVEDIEQVIEVEKKFPESKLMYGFNHRYHSSVEDALKVVHSGDFGKIINLRGVYGKAKIVTFSQNDWRTKREVAGGGVLLDQGIHMVDLMRLFAGEFSEVYSFVSNSFWGYDVEDNAYALMRTDKGVVCMLHSSATQWRHRFSLDINLEKGSINLGGILSGSKSYGSETLCLVWANPDSDNGDPKEQMTRYNEDPSWDREIAVFTESIKINTPIYSGGSMDALLTMRSVFKIYKSDKDWAAKYNI